MVTLGLSLSEATLLVAAIDGQAGATGRLTFASHVTVIPRLLGIRLSEYFVNRLRITWKATNFELSRNVRMLMLSRSNHGQQDTSYQLFTFQVPEFSGSVELRRVFWRDVNNFLETVRPSS